MQIRVYFHGGPALTASFRKSRRLSDNKSAHWLRALTYNARGQLDEAIASAEKAVAVSGRAPAVLGVLGFAYGVAGRKHES